MESQTGIQPVIEGARRFADNVYPQHRDLYERLSHGQHPQVLFVTCSDSRVDPNKITQASPGDLFIHRNPGNIVLQANT